MNYKIEMIILPVSDADRALAFYTENAEFKARRRLRTKRRLPGERAVHRDRRSEDPCSLRQPITVEREAQRGLAHHHRRRRVAGIALCRHMGDVARAARRACIISMRNEISLSARLLAWSLARARNDTIEERADRAECKVASQRGNAAGDGRRRRPPP